MFRHINVLFLKHLMFYTYFIKSFMIWREGTWNDVLLLNIDLFIM